jgi:hypothetical protein
LFRNVTLKIDYRYPMRDPVKEPKYWRARAHATRAKAKRCHDGREIRRMLRVAEEYDKIADLTEAWQRSGKGHVMSDPDHVKRDPDSNNFD